MSLISFSKAFLFKVPLVVAPLVSATRFAHTFPHSGDGEESLSPNLSQPPPRQLKVIRRALNPKKLTHRKSLEKRFLQYERKCHEKELQILKAPVGPLPGEERPAGGPKPRKVPSLPMTPYTYLTILKKKELHREGLKDSGVRHLENKWRPTNYTAAKTKRRIDSLMARKDDIINDGFHRKPQT